jgi:hypothetical protein
MSNFEMKLRLFLATQLTVFAVRLVAFGTWIVSLSNGLLDPVKRQLG